MKSKLNFLELCLNNTRPRPAGFIRSLPGPYTAFELLRILEQAGKDQKLRGLVLNTSGFQAGRSFLWELRTALETFRKSGKKVIAYFDNADFDLYSMLSAADKIIMDKGGMLSFMGHSVSRFYAKETLDKLGIGFRELRCLDYKTANEMFSRVSMSEADREQYGAYLDDIFNLTKETIIKGRNLDENAFNSMLTDGFILPPAFALGKGLVDALGREDAIEKILLEIENEKSGAPKTKTSTEAPLEGKNAKAGSGDEEAAEIKYKIWGASSLMSRGDHAARYRAPRRRGRKAEIALITAKGNTDMDQGMSARDLSGVIFEAAARRAVKALVLRIDSPGGSAVAADYIAEAVREVKKDKPVVISLGEVAASGGYWAAMYGNHINASPYTLTGSIGVIAGWFFNKSLNQKLGINTGALSRGDHADLLSGFLLPSRDLNPGEDEQFRRCIMELYGDFVRKAAEGRNMKEEELEPLARGRVYSGLSAMRLKLIDSLGGYLEALEKARELAGIPENKKIIIREYPKPRFREAIAARFLSASAGVLLENGMAGTISASLNRLRGDLVYRLSQNGRAMPILPAGMIQQINGIH